MSQVAGQGPARTPGQLGRRRQHGPGGDPEGARAVAVAGGQAAGPARGFLPALRIWFRSRRRQGTGRSALLPSRTADFRRGTGRLTRLPRPGTARPAGGRPSLTFDLVAEAACVPSRGGSPFGIGRRFHAVGPRPGQLRFRAEAAAVAPALLGGLAAAGVVLAGVAAAVVLGGGRRQREADDRDQVRGEGEASRQPAGQGPPPLVASRPPHGEGTGSSFSGALPSSIVRVGRPRVEEAKATALPVIG
jgi:hypothetical protein